MSTIENLIRQWCEQIEHYEHAASELEAAEAAEDSQREVLADDSIGRALDALQATDSQIADSVPTCMRDAALLAAFAYRAHNENDMICDECGRLTGEHRFDVPLEKVLATLVHYLVQISGSGISEIAHHWHVPLDGRSARTQRDRQEMRLAHEAWIRALYVEQVTRPQ